ncbi:N-acyl homoserine lactonase family protein [Chloroflexota bacterium]
MYKIYAVFQGQREVDMSRALPGAAAPGEMGYIAYFMYVLKGEGRTILVDTGMDNEEAEKRKLKGTDYLEGMLKKLDKDPVNVDTVILTHLHGDHFSAHELYPNATFYVQKKDVDFFAEGAKFRQVTEFAPDMAKVNKLIQANKLKFLDGDSELFPGIKVVLIGGHSPGSQAIVVTTKQGDAVLCGDAVDLYRTLDEEIIGMYVDLMPALWGMDKIRALTSSPKLIIPGHEPLVMQKFPNPIEGVAEIG